MKNFMLVILAVISLSIVSGIDVSGQPDVLRIEVPVVEMGGRWGRIDVSILDVDDDVVGQARKYIYATSHYHTVPFEIELRKAVSDRDLLRAKVEFKNRVKIYSLFQLEDRMVVQILGQDEFIRGTPINYRIIVRNQRNNAPIDARVKIMMKNGETGKVVFEGKTGRDGSCESDFLLGDGVDEADLHFEVTSALGSDSFDTRVRILSGNVTYLVTDKPVYQPGQTIHIRSLSLRRPGLRAVSEAAIVFEVEDSKGNKVYKKELATDDFGVGYVQFILADEVNLGDYTIRAVLGQDKVEKTVNVKRYVLPKFRIELKTDREYYTPGEQIESDVEVEYFFGKPVADGKVRITAYKYDIGFQQESVIEGRTNNEGHYHFTYRLPAYFVGQPLEQGDAFVRLDVEVIDAANHGEKVSAQKKVVQDMISLAVIPEGGALRPNLENRIYVLATYPDGTPCYAGIEMRFGDRRLKGKTDDYGIAEFVVEPDESQTKIEVRAVDERGETAEIERTFELDKDRTGLIMRLARGIYSVGEPLDLTFLTTRRTGRIYLDVIKNNQTVMTKSIDVRNHRGRYRLNLTDELGGSIWLHAYMVTQGSDIVRDTRFCYVHAADDLLIDVRNDKDEYLPGADGEIVFTVTGQDGQPRVAALCVAVVDEAVFAVSELQPGLERVYFKLEREIMKPRYEIHGFTPVDIVKMKVREARAENVMFSTLVPKDHYRVSYTTPQSINDKIRSGFYTRLEEARSRIYEAQNRYYQRHNEYPKSEGAIDAFMSEGFLREKDMLDPWGKRYRVNSPEEYFYYFTISSSGPDGIAGNGDDVREVMWDEEFNLAVEMDAAVPMAAAGAMREMVKIKKSETADRQPAEEPRVREFFPETFIFEPALITDHQGMATLSVTVPDAITTWRITTFASSPAGELGSVLAQLRVFQDFFVDINLPVALTEGDEISIPIALYNYLPKNQRIRLVLEPAEWFDIMEDKEIVRELKKDEVSVAYFPIKVKKIGYHSILVRAYGEVKSDAIKRSVAVLPDGKLYEDIISDRLSGRVVQRVVFPDNAIGGANWLGLKIFPGIFSQIVEGLDKLLGVPFGCFEQTTSVTYPNILILNYLGQTGQIKPETEMTAEEYISLGYQRLLTFEVAGGGFSWFGDAPANKILTAYGLMEFNDMDKVYEIDERLIERTAQWLRNQQNKDGSWSPDAQYLHAESWGNIQKNEILPTAYICWALGEIGDRGSHVQNGLNYLRKNLDAARDPYVLALVANAFVAVEPKSASTADVLRKLVGMAKRQKDVVYWESSVPSVTFTRGAGVDVEATGLAAYALIRSGRYSDVVSQVLTYLIRAKDKSGVWYTTQGTIVALRSFVAALGGISEKVDAQIAVIVNGNEAAELTIDDSNSDLMHQIDLSEWVRATNTVEITVKGEGNFLYEIASKYYLPWEIVPRGAKPMLAIDVEYDRTRLSVNDIVEVEASVRLMKSGRAEMVMIDLGIPPGFSVLTPTLDELVGKSIQKYSLTPRQIIIYLDKVEFGAPVSIKYGLQAKFPIRAKVRASRAYEYYNTEEGAYEPPIQMHVTM
ncbi:MAG: type II secretion system protein GspG [candidate division WOR-3 bacterium]|nr:MAG: type II secretion system protein GspG [candidate division WOR-3 bacterium]